MRLDKFICESTELTRSLAKRALHRGDVTCDGVVVKNSGFKVLPQMAVHLDGTLISVIGERYIMLNKPIDTICSTIDEQYPSVLSLIDIEKMDTLHIAGRLDVDTTGLVLITSDGQWSHKITSPKKDCGKRYLVELADPIDDSLIKIFADGVELRNEDGLTKPALLDIIDPTHVRLTISEGKYHQVKRMFAAVGNNVVNLHREAVGSIELNADLAAGEWRHLTAAEVKSV
ncbi:MAG: 16S rRNA pseudouridine(516) synthase RsuA [Shewanella psychromarinicola]|uniref:Pseudouridine synthase n=1 Tax=Shewanella psychromarinicola TaxID=2487742 RepID=A0A3N4E0I7_9GAMM|nr:MULTISPECIES: 16S rRNA pseudouridine(516) synthase RsuA [Shewanella]AZG37317.1 16S rRNA pseudouridine(516) synthase RsuA [Shewanella psychromarinicola]MCL1083719.1 16S rRNA pseudouridine(516) synthase RsuA [Shewanella psychromarinicola]PKG78528.1 16S rRNA pseudouridine(516) synthase RsuA [Shewanella sp. Actino-trap-3]RPA27480.1 16S rRNA pseudouridine(516) synthase RsuA [Shewanella psychromarinicola]